MVHRGGLGGKGGAFVVFGHYRHLEVLAHARYGFLAEWWAGGLGGWLVSEIVDGCGVTAVPHEESAE